MAYGCQETDAIVKKEAFWQYLDEEVIFATNSGSGLIFQFDGNLWAGDKIVPNDPRQQNINGKLFAQFLDRNSHLTVVNGLQLCEGLITRRRFREGKLEESVLDFFVVCNLVLPHVTRMVIDEENKYVLTNYKQVKRGGKAANSDHATEYMDLNLKVITEKPKRREIWNFKNKEAQKKFRTLTTETKEFSRCFDNNLSVLEQINEWRTVFNLNVSNAFRKVRVTRKRHQKPIPPVISNLINQRNKLSTSNTDGNNIEALDEEISNLEAEENHKIIMEHFQMLSEDPEHVNIQEVWKTMGKLWPKVGVTLPAAKRNHDGKLVSEPTELKKLLAKEYKERLRTRPVRPDLEQLENRKTIIFEMKMKLAESKSSTLWTWRKHLETSKTTNPEIMRV